MQVKLQSGFFFFLLEAVVFNMFICSSLHSLRQPSCLFLRSSAAAVQDGDTTVAFRAL